MSESEGVLYIATNDEFVREAELSISQLREYHPGWPVAVITTTSQDIDGADEIIVVEDSVDGFGDKPRYMDRSPFDRTLYLDTDTYVVGDISSTFDLLTEFDVACAIAPSAPDSTDGCNPGDAFPTFNSGVVLYRDNPSTQALFDRWRHEYKRDLNDGYHPDQRSFRRSLFDTHLEFTPLPTRYNMRPFMFGAADGPAKIIHSRLVEPNGDGMEFLEEIGHVAEKLTASDKGRVWWQYRGVNVRVSGPQSTLQRIINRLHYDGVIGLIKRGIDKFRD